MSSPPKINLLLIGSGGVGTMAAYALETGGQCTVSAVLRSNYTTIMQQGFTINSIDHGQDIKAFRPTNVYKHIPSPAQAPFDYILIATKNIPDVPPSIAELIAPAVTPNHTTIVLFQNGLNIEKPLIEAYPTNIILSGVSYISASEPQHGTIIHEGPDKSSVGVFPHPTIPLSVSSASAKKFIEAYSACGVAECSYDPDVRFTRWRKLVYNASYNPISAILGMGVITMRKTRHVIDELVRPCMREIIAVAKAAGVDLPEGVDDFFILMDPVEDDFVPSMGQDAAKGNYMELETIVGEPVREAERLGVEVPTLRVVYALLKGLQVKTKVKKGVERLEFEKGNPYA